MPEDIAPVEKTVVVPLSPDAAFDLFTDGMGDWWPLDRHAAGVERPEDLTVEPREGGRIYETAPDGHVTDWATITEWTPGARLAFDWHAGRDPSQATQVSVTFLPEGNGTRVDLVHDGFDRLFDGATMRAGCRKGWDMALDCDCDLPRAA